ncbi:MAG: Hsp20/alpha crystallin family protein [Candidatus Eremiobacteraeota bacterium]|nr:Hsp20/alpha crystallin family protein [Candidatus Eremiobacteraeota bacterium]MBC5827360.1 Hsp20/alpha crystallin family protein [Candidatus Eremiobacteraeota bacterium]
MYPDDLFQEFERMFAELSLPMSSHARRGSFNPNADVHVTDGGRTLLVRVELAGVSRDNIKLVVEGASLYLAGLREAGARRADGVLQKEIEYGYFLKRIQLPSRVDVSEARAEYKNGMLSIKLPVLDSSPMLGPDRMEIRMIVRGRG